ncbi:hypothetical protein Voc01_082990 [Virgisporangium ochraceum]|uniref:Uncharacterized protein n=1 Tax=Virgisporangium ochraceum TaxID=65505 RepID=A0A8J4A0A5_9ACTN|nr:hypothetical protein Voc01_082990 [Virgisporangium ochraceum]
MNRFRRSRGTWYSTDEWKTTSVAPAGASAASARRSSTRSPRTSLGGDDGRGGAQAGPAVAVFGPDERVEPGDVGGVGDVERVEVEAGAPDDDGQVPGRGASGDGALEDGSALADHVVAVPVGVAVGVQAQAGGGADLQQGQRLREHGEHREQQGAPAGLVGLGGAGAQFGLDGWPVRHGEVVEGGGVVDGTGEPADHPEKQVRLLLRGWHGAEQVEDGRVRGDGVRQPLVRRRDSVRLPLGELGVPGRDRHAYCPTPWMR